MELTQEKSEIDAALFMDAARLVGMAIDAINLRARAGCAGVCEEKEAAESIMINGEKTMVALRTVAMRIDRAAMLRTNTN